MVHRTRDLRGTEFLDNSPEEKERNVCSLSLNFPDGSCRLWPKTRQISLDRKEKQSKQVLQRVILVVTADADQQDLTSSFQIESELELTMISLTVMIKRFQRMGRAKTWRVSSSELGCQAALRRQTAASAIGVFISLLAKKVDYHPLHRKSRFLQIVAISFFYA